MTRFTKRTLLESYWDTLFIMKIRVKCLFLWLCVFSIYWTRLSVSRIHRVDLKVREKRTTDYQLSGDEQLSGLSKEETNVKLWTVKLVLLNIDKRPHGPVLYEKHTKTSSILWWLKGTRSGISPRARKQNRVLVTDQLTGIGNTLSLNL